MDSNFQVQLPTQIQLSSHTDLSRSFSNISFQDRQEGDELSYPIQPLNGFENSFSEEIFSSLSPEYFYQPNNGPIFNGLEISDSSHESLNFMNTLKFEDEGFSENNFDEQNHPSPIIIQDDIEQPYHYNIDNVEEVNNNISDSSFIQSDLKPNPEVSNNNLPKSKATIKSSQNVSTNTSSSVKSKQSTTQDKKPKTKPSRKNLQGEKIQFSDEKPKLNRKRSTSLPNVTSGKFIY